MKKAIVLLSGGLDSATTLFYAIKKCYRIYALIFDYQQRHRKEICQAKKIAKFAQCEYHVLKISLPWKASSLLDKTISLPQSHRIDPKRIPSTYVPARNIIFLSFAASYADAIGARRIFIGANTVDYSGYPDCRPEFFAVFQKVLSKGVKSGVEKKAIKVVAPLLKKTKAEIIKLGFKLNVPYALTWSCYQGTKKPCGKCDSCVLRQRGFNALKRKDPLLS